MKTAHKTKGESILELLLAVAVFAMVIPAILYVVGSTADRQSTRNWYYESLLMLEDLTDAIRQKKTDDWEMFSKNAKFLTTRSGATWTFSETQDIPVPTIENDLIASIETGDVMRNSDGDIVESGGYVDPASRKITISIDWYGAVSKTVSSFYITRTDRLGEASITTKSEFENGASFDGMLVEVVATPTPSQVSVGVDAPGPLPGAMTYWNMNGENFILSSEIDVAEGGTDNLFFEGSPQFVTSRFGKGLKTASLDTMLYASSSARLELAGSASIVVWLKSPANPTAPETIVDKYNNNSGYQVQVIPGGQVEVTIGGGVSSISAKTSNNILDGLWHMVAFVYDNQSLKPYFDGAQNGEVVSGQSQLYSGDEIITIGNDNAERESPYSGVIDEVAIYANALSDVDVENLSYSTYVSGPIDISASALVHNFVADVVSPNGSRSNIQLSVTNKVNGVCQTPSKFVGPSGQVDGSFGVGHEGLATVSYPFPMGNYLGAGYSNPGECVSFRYRVFWNKDSGPSETLPGLSKAKILFSL